MPEGFTHSATMISKGEIKPVKVDSQLTRLRDNRRMSHINAGEIGMLQKRRFSSRGNDMRSSSTSSKIDKHQRKM